MRDPGEFAEMQERMRNEKLEKEKRLVEAGLPVKPPDPVRPVVHQGSVLMHLYNELTTVFQRCQAADAFEKKIIEAAKSPAAWLLLREELSPSKDVAP